MHRYVHQLEAQRAVADSLTSMFNTKSKELITTLMVEFNKRLHYYRSMLRFCAILMSSASRTIVATIALNTNVSTGLNGTRALNAKGGISIKATR